MKRKKLSAITGISPDGKKYQTSRDYILSRCSIGIEIEVENMRQPIREINTEEERTAGLRGLNRREPTLGRRRPPTQDLFGEYWKVVSDGSLRNNGIEFISSPVWGEDINRALDNLQLLVTQSGNEPDFSERTSVHIHLDVRNLDTLQLFNLLVLVMIFERTLVRYCGGVREENVFCLPFYKAEAAVSTLANLADENVDFLRVLDSTFKYNGFNIRPIARQGSVEFRYHYGTMDKNRIKEWINIIYCLKREATKIDDILALPEEISKMGVNGYMNKVFGKYAKVLDNTTINDDVYAGIRLAQDIIYASRHKKIKKGITYGRVNKVAKANGKKALQAPVEKLDPMYTYDDKAPPQVAGNPANELEDLMTILRG